VDEGAGAVLRNRGGRRHTDDRALKALILALVVVNLALAAWMALWPGSFSRTIGGFGVRNDHYVRDVATWSLALGLALLASLWRRSWRVPLLFMAALQAVLHLVNHVTDVGNADPGWIGPLDVVLLSVLAVAFAVALGAATRSRARRPAVGPDERFR
jgi:peptidoglycan/LPS O-acetylase OafA/YrhL